MAAKRQSQELHQSVLEVLREANTPMAAYDILEALKEPGQKLAPTTIYRALNALGEQGVVHKVEAKNAYMACQEGGHDHPSLISYCEDCGEVSEHLDDALAHDMERVARAQGFHPKRHVIELHGVCAPCHDKKEAMP